MTGQLVAAPFFSSGAVLTPNMIFCIESKNTGRSERDWRLSDHGTQGAIRQSPGA
jgi:hypothetical protein